MAAATRTNRYWPLLLCGVWLVVDAGLFYSLPGPGPQFLVLIALALGQLIAVSGHICLSWRGEWLLLSYLGLTAAYYAIFALGGAFGSVFVTAIAVGMYLFVVNLPLLILRHCGFSVRRVEWLDGTSSTRWKFSLRGLFGLTTAAAVCFAIGRALWNVPVSDQLFVLVLLPCSLFVLAWVPWFCASRFQPLPALLVTALLSMAWGSLVGSGPLKEVEMLAACIAFSLAAALHINLLRLAGYDLVTEFDEGATYRRLP